MLWLVEPHGLVTLSTGTLVERPTPYLLPLELARGTINQLRHQLFEWQSIGLATPPAVAAKLVEVTRHFSLAACQDRPLEAAVASERDPRGAGCLAVVSQHLRRAVDPRPPPWHGQARDAAGAPLENPLPDAATTKHFLSAFNTAIVPICWREVEASERAFSWETTDAQILWCRANGLKISRAL